MAAARLQAISKEEERGEEIGEKVTDLIGEVTTNERPKITEEDVKRQSPLDPIEVARQRVDRMVGDVADQAIMELGKAADEIHELTNKLGERRNEIIASVKDYAEFADRSIKAKSVITEHLARIRNGEK